MSNVTWSELVGIIAPSIVFYDAERTNDEIKKVIANTTREAVIETAERLGGLKRTGRCDIQGGVFHYPISSPDDWRVHKVDCVWVEGMDPECFGYWRDNCKMPYGPYFQYTFNECVLQLGMVPETDKPRGLKIETRVVPTSRSCGINQKLFDRYRTIIRYKTLSLLYDQGAQQWHSERKARTQESNFNRALNDELWNQRLDHSGNDYKLMPQGFFDS